MRGKRRFVGLVLAVTLAAAALAAPAEAMRFRPDDAAPAVIVAGPEAGLVQGWFAHLWSWWTALVGADNGQIVP